MRAIYYILILALSAAHYGIIANLRRECVETHLFYLPCALLPLSYLLFRSLVGRAPDEPPGTDIEGMERSEDTPVCSQCLVIRAPTTHHCSLCKRCVVRFDHHCDVLDLCIGQGNIHRFRIFLFYHASLLGYATCAHYQAIGACHAQRQSVATPLVVAVLVEFSIAFALSTFWLFHGCLFLCGLRTYDLIRGCHRCLGRRRAAATRVKSVDDRSKCD